MKLNCVVVLQYLCQAKMDYEQTDLDRLRDGIVTDSQDYLEIVSDSKTDYEERKKEC